MTEKYKSGKKPGNSRIGAAKKAEEFYSGYSSSRMIAIPRARKEMSKRGLNRQRENVLMSVRDTFDLTQKREGRAFDGASIERTKNTERMKREDPPTTQPKAKGCELNLNDLRTYMELARGEKGKGRTSSALKRGEDLCLKRKKSRAKGGECKRNRPSKQRKTGGL